MASSKLKGEVEIFETPDAEVEEDEDYEDEDVDSKAETVEEGNEDIDIAKLRPSSAFDAFSGKEREGCRVYRTSKGSESGRSLSDRGVESTAVKYRRIKEQVRDFMEELERLSTAEQKEKTDNFVAGSAEDIATATKGTFILRQRLEALETNEKFRGLVDPEFKVRSMLREQDARSTMLLRDIRAFGGGAGAAPSTSSSDDGRITYELYCDENKNISKSRASDVESLEKRLHALEKCVGGGAKTRDEGADKPLVECVRSMEDQIRLLDTRKLDHLSRRMKVVASEYESFARRMARARSKSGGAANPLRLQKLTKALEQIDAYEHQSVMLPAIVERLKTLRALHEGSAQFSLRLDALERAQTEALSAVTEGQKALERIEKNMEENMSTVQKNVAHLDKRIAAVLES